MDTGLFVGQRAATGQLKHILLYITINDTLVTSWNQNVKATYPLIPIAVSK